MNRKRARARPISFGKSAIHPAGIAFRPTFEVDRNSGEAIRKFGRGEKGFKPSLPEVEASSVFPPFGGSRPRPGTAAQLTVLRPSLPGLDSISPERQDERG